MAGKPLIDGSFRLTIGTGDQMRRFVTAFSAVIGGEEMA
jgi:histidinol-phosphate/aromatic aminotransferase/cobyric acid decarboxylase-like protein